MSQKVDAIAGIAKEPDPLGPRSKSPFADVAGPFAVRRTAATVSRSLRKALRWCFARGWLKGACTAETSNESVRRIE